MIHVPLLLIMLSLMLPPPPCPPPLFIHRYSVAALLEAAEQMIPEGVKLRRTVLFAFGHDEEVRGRGQQEVRGSEGID